MDPKFLVLAIPSLVQLLLLIWHMTKYRGKKTTFAFLFFGFLFGLIRSQVIHFIQIDLNNSVIPYEFGNAALKIGHDSLQVYIGWITTAYLAWCFGEMIYRSLNKETDPSANHNSSGILPVIGYSFFFISAFSYLIEATASVTGWWRWNQFLESGFDTSIFANVPWVGIIDWSTVAFEFLGIFLFTRYAIKNKSYKYLFFWIVPLIHWGSHINFLNPAINDFNAGIIIHLLLPIFAIILIFKNGPKIEKTSDKKIGYASVWIGLIITYAVCLGSLLHQRSYSLLISLVPITLIAMLAIDKIKKNLMATISTILIIASMVFLREEIQKLRVLVAFYPVLLLTIIKAEESFPIRPKWNLREIGTKIGKVALLLAGVIILALMFLTENNDDNYKEAAVDSQKSPNVIIVSLDNLRADRVGAINNSSTLTPNLDKLAEESITYTNAYTPIPYTLPAHVSIMTGLEPVDSGFRINSSTTSITINDSLANKFANQGYQTAAFIGSGILDKDIIKSGFDYFDSNLTEINIPDNAPPENSYIPQRSATEVNNAFVSWSNQNVKAPFFAFIHYFDIHSPYKQRCGLKETKLVPDHKELLSGEVRNQNISEITQNDYRYLEYLYDQEVACTDQALGELMRYLKDNNLYQDSYIVVLGDHGENFDHNSIFHGENIYQSAIRVPLVIKTPFESEKKIVDDEVSLIDIYPTLLNVLSDSNNSQLDHYYDLIEKSDNIDGERKIFLETTPLPKTKVSEDLSLPLADRIFGMIEKNQKIVFNTKSKQYEYYHLKNDPLENSNLYWGNLSEKFEELKKIMENHWSIGN